MPVGARLSQRAFPVKFLLQPAQRFLDRLALF
jgi:hypothetical protein